MFVCIICLKSNIQIFALTEFVKKIIFSYVNCLYYGISVSACSRILSCCVKFSMISLHSDNWMVFVNMTGLQWRGRVYFISNTSFWVKQKSEYLGMSIERVYNSIIMYILIVLLVWFTNASLSSIYILTMW